MKKNIFTAVVLILLAISFIANIYFFMENLKGKNDALRTIAMKEEEFKKELASNRELVRKDMQEAQMADTVSLEAMGKRLEVEKNKVMELEKKLKSATNNGQ